MSNIYDKVFCGNSEQILAINHSPAAWQNLVTRFLAILCYHQFLGYLGLENGKTQQLFIKNHFSKTVNGRT